MQDETTLNAPCTQTTPETNGNGVAVVDAERRRRGFRRRGAEIGNRRSTTHGLRMTGGRLPAGAAWIRREADDMKRRLDAAVIEAKGELSILDVATINEVAVWERHRLLAQRWLRLSCDEMSHDQRLAYKPRGGQSGIGAQQGAAAAGHRPKLPEQMGCAQRHHRRAPPPTAPLPPLRTPTKGVRYHPRTTKHRLEADRAELH